MPAASSLVPMPRKPRHPELLPPLSSILQKSLSRALSRKSLGTGALVPGEKISWGGGQREARSSPSSKPAAKGLVYFIETSILDGAPGLFKGFSCLGGAFGAVATMGMGSGVHGGAQGCMVGRTGVHGGAHGGAWWGYVGGTQGRVVGVCSVRTAQGLGFCPHVAAQLAEGQGQDPGSPWQGCSSPRASRRRREAGRGSGRGAGHWGPHA